MLRRISVLFSLLLSGRNTQYVNMLSAEPFDAFYLVNYNDTVKEEDLASEHVRRIWSCNWTVKQLEGILQAWRRTCKNTEVLQKPITAGEQLCNLIELTLIFVQHNFTGPFHQQEEFRSLLDKLAMNDVNPFERLMENSEELNPNVQLGELLVLAKEMLTQLLKYWPESLVLHWWQLRLICIQQHVLDELTSDLYEQLKSVANFLLAHVNNPLFIDKEVRALLYLEVANSHLQFHHTQKAEQLLNELCDNLQVVLRVEGLLGVRTKFQQKALPQLCLKVEQSLTLCLPPSATTNGSVNLPKLLSLDDDTRLERIRFIETISNEVMTLPSVLQALVLAKVKLLKRAQPKDRLADEELEPYVRTLLYQQYGPLQVRQSSLLLNCTQEANQSRTVERSWKQCEEAIKLLNGVAYTLPERLSYAFGSCMQPKWHVQEKLCELLVSLGMTKTALDIYLTIKAWRPAIDCYTRLEQRHKAAELIRQELAKQPTVLLHCLLGDATDEPACYETAWKFSKQTSGRAQAHWGNYYYRRGEYAAAIPHLQKSVQINALQEQIWLRLGYAAIMLERWELAVHAYITYTHLEPLGYESWNNLAKALIKLGDKRRAHKVLAESLKCNFTNWKVWENFMLVSVDTGHFDDAMNAYSRLCEIKERFLDVEILCIITSAIAAGQPDAKGQNIGYLSKKAITLLGQQCVQHGNEPKLWQMAASLASTPLNKAQKLVKALRAYMQRQSDWALQPQHTVKVLQLCNEMCAHSLSAITEHMPDESEALITSQLNSARLTAQACVRSAEKGVDDCVEHDALLAELKQLQEQLAQQVKQRIASI